MFYFNYSGNMKKKKNSDRKARLIHDYRSVIISLAARAEVIAPDPFITHLPHSV